MRFFPYPSNENPFQYCNYFLNSTFMPYAPEIATLLIKGRELSTVKLVRKDV